VQAKHPAGAQHPGDAVQRDRLPEVGQLMQAIAGVHRIGGRPGVLVAEEPGLHTRKVRHGGRGGSHAQELQHRR